MKALLLKEPKLKPSILLQHLLPKQLLTTGAGKLANLKAGAITTQVIAWFVKRYNVNMDEAANPNIASYATFNEFFTRALKPNARPLESADLICPVDGAISQFGDIKADQIFQAKGHQYSSLTLLAGNTELAKVFENGSFATLYLSPRDYHRIHMPCAARLLSMTYVPGDLFSVNPTTAENVAGLFARNERVVCEFETDFGQFVLILVGATIVGSMETTWHGVVNPPRMGKIRTWDYTQQNLTFKQGDEMGRFLLGSTVIMLFPSNTISYNKTWFAKKTTRLGEYMANKTPR